MPVRLETCYKQNNRGTIDCYRRMREQSQLKLDLYRFGVLGLNASATARVISRQARSQGEGGAPGAYAPPPPQAQATPKKGLNYAYKGPFRSSLD